jgi:glyoxylase-like metal-dependent hydrolase (beta-lactamase superfamily II)
MTQSALAAPLIATVFFDRCQQPREPSMKALSFFMVATLAVAAPSFAQTPRPERIESVEIRSQKVADGFYVITGFGGAMVVSIGEQGVLVVDTQIPELVPRITAEIEKLGGAKIDFAINTHWHYDHADGNMGYGPLGVWFVAQAESAKRMAMDNVVNPMQRPAFKQPAYPTDARPIMSFDTRMQFNFNGGIVDLIHFGPAHTAGDAAVFFRKHNAVHMGDVMTPRGYPFVDVDNGGDIDGMITFCRAVLTEIKEDTVVIPGHGPVTDYADLVRYTEMLQSTRDRVAEMIKAGASLEQIVAAKPTAAWDASYGRPNNFIDRVYTSLTR